MELGMLSSKSHLDQINKPIFKEYDAENETGPVVSLGVMLPDDILEKIFSFLPIVSVIRARAVCKRWHEAVQSGRCLWKCMPVQRPWYFMFACTESVIGYAYDPSDRKWYSFDFPCIDTPNWFVSSSHGLVCFLDYDSRSRILICNPVTRDSKRLREIDDGRNSPDYAALALTVDSRSRSYTVAVVKSRQVPEDFLRWELSIQVYDSGSESWVASIWEVLMGWRAGDESVICNGILYCLLYSFAGNERRHGLIAYDLSSRCSNVSLMRSVILVPCSLTCGRLMNLKERLVMVGGIGKADRPDIIKGIGIWELHEKEWREIGRVPHKYFQGFGELDDVFASSGSGDIVYIQSFGAPALLTFDMSQRQWRWSAKSPVMKKFPLQLFTGFCFEPRLEVTP